ncbi:RHS repeat-associated core domain-containing protein [Undibacterium sp. Di26W]|uniref:RHS repeat-associated core domain-containing protein n=1 Tax=Undibacterium sp. Di26W TaxID=3413035 RepID=UPI003BF0896A
MNSTLQTVRRAWGSLQLSAMGVVLLSCFAVPGVQAQTTTPPTISLAPAVLQTTQAAPANGNFIAPASISLTATATAVSGSSINQVQFYQGTTLIATASAPTIANGNSYSVNWTNVTANSYSVTAKATDSANATATSTPVTVNVINNSPPTVSMTANPASATAPATIILNATATDTDGTIAKVEFFNGATTIATITTAPFTTNWANVAQGTYSITARATDNLGAITTSAAVPVSVTANVPKAYDIHSDQINTPRVITDANGNEVWRWDSAPFGETVPNEQPTTATNKFTFNLRFPGQYFDAETNLHYNYYRDYDPQAGRYVESDPIGLRGGSNTYAYVKGDPVSNIDPKGLRPLTPWEKCKLWPFLPERDLGSTDIHIGEMPWYAPNWATGITRGNDIYFRNPNQSFVTNEDLALLGHEVVHVGQYADGMTWASYLWDSQNGYEKNQKEIDAYAYQAVILNSLNNGDKKGEKNCTKECPR